MSQTPTITTSEKFDLYTYTGAIMPHGYHALCEHLKEKSHNRAILAITTPGGDPHAAFRIARALQHEYPDNGFVALVPGYCKSAGTLIVTGAKSVFMADMSELGPLDIQVRKGDELFARNSGLEIFEAVTFLQNQTLGAFIEQAKVLASREGLSTRVAADIAARLTRGIFEPIAAQIDPIKLAEMQRANDITMAYGSRLAEVGGNLLPNGVAALIGGYPSHGFVIDRKEARSIFTSVFEPRGKLLELSEHLREDDPSKINMHPPRISRTTVELALQEDYDDDSKCARVGGAGAAPSDRAIHEDGIPDSGSSEGGS